MSTARPARARAWTVGALIREGTRCFRKARIVFGHGTLNAADEAAWLVSHVLRRAPDEIGLSWSKIVSDRAASRILALFRRRIRERQPAAYLTHEAWLVGARFHVDKRVIVPRSHIAGLLKAGLEPWLGHADRVRSVLDLCTGSGCLAVLAAHAFPRAHVDAADISRRALQVARRNVNAHHLARRIRVIHSDLYSKLHGRRYDLIVCNPPYVTTYSMRRLPPEYRHEPALALGGGPDGLDLVRRILAESAAHLKPRGVLVVEVGRGRNRLERAFPRAPFVWPEADFGSAVFLLDRDDLETQRWASSSEARSSRTRPRVSSTI